MEENIAIYYVSEVMKMIFGGENSREIPKNWWYLAIYRRFGNKSLIFFNISYGQCGSTTVKWTTVMLYWKIAHTLWFILYHLIQLN